MMIPIVIGAHETVVNGFDGELEEFEIRESIEIIHTTALAKPARILRGVLKTRGDLLSHRLQ